MFKLYKMDVGLYKKVEKCLEIAAKLVIIVLISKFEDAAGGGFLVLE